MTAILGAVLAGGQSRRFGSDKALALAHGRTLLDHAVAALEEVTPHVVICGREWPGRTSLPDRPEGRLGPLAGLNAALHHARDAGFAHVLSIACDTPFLATAGLAALAAQGRPAFVADHPVIGLWPVDAAQVLDARLHHEDDRSVRGFARAIGALPFAFGADIANFNHADDLAQWLAASLAVSGEKR